MKKNIWAVLVIVAIFVSTAVGVILIRRYSSFTFHVQMDEGGGLQPGDIVYIYGVRIGEVADLKAQDQGVLADIILQADSSAKPHQNDILVVWDDKFFLGKKCILILPGDPNRGIPLRSGDIAHGYGSRAEIIKVLGVAQVKVFFNKLQDWLDNPDTTGTIR